MSRKQLFATQQDVDRAWKCVQEAEAALGELSRGQRRDLIKDNMPWHADRCEHAERVMFERHGAPDFTAWIETFDD